MTGAGSSRARGARVAPRRPHAAAPRPSLDLCPRCGIRVLVTPAGQLLDPETHPLAIFLPDGSRVTIRQAAEVLTGRSAPIGHHPHHEDGYGCEPAARQLPLFAA